MNFNYNPNPYNSNYNDPYYNPQFESVPHRICTRCSNQGYFIDNYGIKFTCLEHIYPQPYVMPPQENIYTNYRPENIYTHAYHVFKDCINCGGRGFIDSRNHQRGKYCYDCIRATGTCPVCNNTGYKLKNGKRCKCGLF